MRRVLCFVIVSLSQCCVAEQARTAVVSGSAFSKEVTVRYDGVSRQIVVEQKDITAELHNGIAGYCEVFAIADTTEDRLFWWISLPGSGTPSPADITNDITSFLDSHIIRFTPKKIVVFWPTYGFSLKVLSSGVKCSSDDECWSGVYSRLNEELLRDYFQIGHGIVTVDLKKALGESFATKKEDRLSAAPRIAIPKIESLDRVGREWHVSIRGPNDDLGTVVLDDEFNVVKASHATEKPQEGDATSKEAGKLKQ